MLKLGIQITNLLKYRNSRNRFRGKSYWMDEYPSPEPSFIIKALNRVGDNIYYGLERFFAGGISPEGWVLESIPDNSEITYKNNSYVWDLNQGISDIIIKDIEVGLSYFIPTSLRNLTSRLAHNFTFYFQADFTVTDDFYYASKTGDTLINPLTTDAPAKVIEHNPSVEVNRPKLLYFNKWIKLISLAKKVFLRLWSPNKLYYLFIHTGLLPAYNSIYYHRYKIRGPDNCKLNSPSFFPKRN